MLTSNTAKFVFYSELNFFLDNNKQNKEIKFNFNNNPSIKDSIEALGVPHTEVGLIKINDISVDFNYRINNGDNISVYPIYYSKETIENTLLREEIKDYTFMVDANIGKMAKYLRMMGFDTYYDLSIHDKEIVEISEKQKRIILTRDIGMLKRKNATHGYFVRNTDIKKQVIEIIKRFSLSSKIRAFSLCFECNNRLAIIEKETIKDKVPEKVYEEHNNFYECKKCNKIFWKGSHYTKMLNDIEFFRNKGLD
ncbi:MAG: Mut7-C RNAse domain-containing protein [Cyanobacteriota bacterium]